jgi:hypothetical protein
MIRLLVLSLALVSTSAFADGGSSVHRSGKAPEYSHNAKITCRNGEESIGEVQDGSENGTRTIFVCRDGKFVPKFGKAPGYIQNPEITCREGQVAFWEVQDGSENGTRMMFVCRNGKFVLPYR